MIKECIKTGQTHAKRHKITLNKRRLLLDFQFLPSIFTLKQSFAVVIDWHMKETASMAQLNQHTWPFSRYCKGFSNLFCEYFGYDWPCLPKLIVSTFRKVWCSSACQKLISLLPSFFWYCKDIANLLILVFWTCLGVLAKNDGSACSIWCYLQANQIYRSPFSWNISKIVQTLYFRYFGQAWLRPTKQ